MVPKIARELASELSVVGRGPPPDPQRHDRSQARQPQRRHQREGRGPQAMLAKQAIHLAEPGGFIRLFVDLGQKMADLLNQLYDQDLAPHYINQILNAFGTKRQSPGQATESSRTIGDGGRPPDSVGIVESLTNRELDVLNLLAQGLTNKEIAAQLVVSPGTVTQHTHNIYQKLMVKNRRLAVIEATKLGILTRD